MNSGIYIITNLINSKYYIGYASDFIKRKSRHFKDLEYNRHHSIHLQRAYNMYGKENFTFEILEEYPNEGNILPSMENWWINMLDTKNPEFGYNIKSPNPEKYRGKMAQETKDKLSIINTGKKQSKETIKRRIDSSRKTRGDKWHSQETINKITATNSGKKREKTDKDIEGYKKLHKVVLQYNLNNNFIKEYESLTIAAKDNNILRGSLSNIVRLGLLTPFKNYIWKYKID